MEELTKAQKEFIKNMLITWECPTVCQSGQCRWCRLRDACLQKFKD